MVGPLGELIDEVFMESPVLDFEAVCEHKPVPPRGLEPHALSGNPLVDQLGSDRLATTTMEGEPSAVNPSGDGVVVLLRHQQREGEPTQYAF